MPISNWPIGLPEDRAWLGFLLIRLHTSSHGFVVERSLFLTKHAQGGSSLVDASSRLSGCCITPFLFFPAITSYPIYFNFTTYFTIFKQNLAILKPNCIIAMITKGLYVSWHPIKQQQKSVYDVCVLEICQESCVILNSHLKDKG